MRIDTDGEEVAVSGTTIGPERRLFLGGALGFGIDIELAQHMVFVRYKDLPGVIGLVGSMFGDAGVNIANMAVSRTKEGGKALMVFSVDTRATSSSRSAARDGLRRRALHRAGERRRAHAGAEWPEPVERVAAFLRATGAEARLEELRDRRADGRGRRGRRRVHPRPGRQVARVRRDDTPVVVLVPGDRKADTGKIARALGARKVTIASATEVVEATGFAPGASRHSRSSAWRVVLVERTLLRHGVVWAGAGSDRHMLAISPPSSCGSRAVGSRTLVLESP